MNHEKLKIQMKNFSIEDLKKFLGKELYESLFEWNTSNHIFSSKAILTDMIISIQGLNILKEREFRKQLLKTFSKNEILSFRQLLPKNYKKSENLEEIIEYIASCKWRENKINNKLLLLLDYSSEEVFLKDNIIEDRDYQKISSFDEFYELLDYQYIIRQRALNILNSPNFLNRFLIHMPTGTGKTKTAMHILCHHYNYHLNKNGLVIWVAHTSELLQQAHDTFISVWKHIGNGNVNCYKLWGNSSLNLEDELSGFMICGIQKLQALMSNNPLFFNQIVNNTRLIIYDEAHKAVATETKNTIECFMRRTAEMGNCALMGLSATPGRATSLNFNNDLLVSMFGNKIISIDTQLINNINLSPQEALNIEVETDIIKYFQKRGVLSQIIKEELIYPNSITDDEMKEIKVITTANGYNDFSSKTLEIIGKNKKRNLEILKKLRALNHQKKPTIVFACSVKHGQLLSSMLTLENIPNTLIIGEMSPQDRINAIKRFKDTTNDMNIIINYEVLTTGFDATNIECVFITRPTQSIVLYSQMLGRGLRGPEMGGKKECLLIDVKDNLCQYNENLAFSHFNNYWNL